MKQLKLIVMSKMSETAGSDGLGQQRIPAEEAHQKGSQNEKLKNKALRAQGPDRLFFVLFMAWVPCLP